MEAQTLEIDGWRAGLRFSACHILPGHPKCSRMHGHTYAVHLRLTGTPGRDGLIIDFGRAKSILRELVEPLDHRFLVPERDPGLDMLEPDESVKFRYDDRGYTLPAQDVVFLPLEAISGEALSAWLLERFLEELGETPNISVAELGVDEGPGQGAWARWER